MPRDVCQALKSVSISIGREETLWRRQKPTVLLNWFEDSFWPVFRSRFKLIKSEYDLVFRPWGVILGCV